MRQITTELKSTKPTAIWFTTSIGGWNQQFYVKGRAGDIFFLLSLAEAEVLQQLKLAFQLLKLQELEETDEAEDNEEEYLSMIQILFWGKFYAIVFSIIFLIELSFFNWAEISDQRSSVSYRPSPKQNFKYFLIPSVKKVWSI